MPTYRFRLEPPGNPVRETALDIPDAVSAERVAKYIARHLASQEVVGGRLPISANLIIFDEDGMEVASLPLGKFVSVC